MRARALAYSLVGCAAALGLTWQLGRAAAPPAPQVVGTPSAGAAASAPSGSSAAGSPSAAPPGSAAPTASAAATSGSAGPSGAFPGATEQTRYGPVQVEILVRRGRITDVKALQLTNDGGRSVAISAAAAPVLRREALRAQSARVDAVSGATYTSEGYRTSLQSAIDRAGL